VDQAHGRWESKSLKEAREKLINEAEEDYDQEDYKYSVEIGDLVEAKSKK
jgi:hypothetical protein